MLRSYHPLLLHGFKTQQEDLIHVRCGYITFFFSLYFSLTVAYISINHVVATRGKSCCCYQEKKSCCCYQGKIMSSVSVNELYKTIQEQVD